jgi:hypothetical protein
VKIFAKKNSTDFSAAMNFLIENELNNYGYFKKDYQPEPGMVDETIKAEPEPTVEKGTETEG